MLLKIAVLSDIHAYAESELENGKTRPSYVETSAPESPTSNPFVALRQLIDREALSADILISGGDLGDRASPQALSYAWKEIEKIRARIGAHDILAATGNHDMDSRAINSYDAKGSLQSLDGYPFDNEALRDSYWANNAVVQQRSDYRSVLLNSAAYHGYTEEFKHGRISRRTREYIRSRLETTTDPGLNLFVTHHHLYPIGPSNLSDRTEMRDASALLELLSSGEFGSWLVVHGHRHWPSLSQAPGGQGAPVVFSAGSFSAVLYDEIQDKARNQFYMLEVETGAIGHRVRGTFRAWDWISDQGFRPARENSGLPHVGGFGGAKPGPELADDVAAYYEAKGEPFLNYADVVAAVPDLQFTMPKDMDAFEAHLNAQYEIAVLSDGGVPAQIGKRSAK